MLQVLDFPVAENHFFSLSLDLSSPFPFSKALNYSNDFCWNQRWIAPFARVSASSACVILFQGAAKSLHIDGRSPNITYILKRSVLNPGTRYLARGLNDSNNPANECECELIFYDKPKYFVNAWRRGSCPLKWKTVLSSSISTPQHIVCDTPAGATKNYFESISHRLFASEVIAVCLLMEGQEHGESDLLNAYCSTAKEIQSLRFFEFDINKVLNGNDSIATFRTFASQIAQISNFSKLQNHQNPDFSDFFRVYSTESYGATEGEQQKELFRFNCADSLDRTNLATFYYALMITSAYSQISHNFENPNGNSKSDNVDQSVVDFIAEAFIEAGDVVSMLYTDTAAIKTNQIRAFMSNTESKSSDSAITIVRRYHNVASDPCRQKVIEGWTSVPEFKPRRFELDGAHISILSNIFIKGKRIVDHSIFEQPVRPFLFDANVNSSIVVMLPEKLVLCGVEIYLYPSPPPMLSIGTGSSYSDIHTFFASISLPEVSDPSWVFFDLRKIMKSSLQFPIDGHSCAPARFVLLEFSSFDDHFTIGNLRLQVRFPNGKTRFFISSDSSERDNIQNFKAGYPLDKEPSQADAIKIEEERMKCGISDFSRNAIAVRNGINPFLFDNLTEPQRAECISKSAKYALKVEETVFPLQKCQVYDRNFDDISSISWFFSYPLSGEGDINSILGKCGGFWSIPAEKARSLSFILCFPTPCIITQIILFFLEGTEIKISAMSPDLEQFEIAPETTSPRAKVFRVNGPPDPYNSVSIQMDLQSSSQRISFKGFKVLGKLMESPMIETLSDQADECLLPAFRELKFDWAEEKRTQRIMLDKPSSIRGVIIRVLRGQSHSIIVSFFSDGKFVDYFNYMVPYVETDSETDLYYPYSLGRQTFTEVRVFYLDRSPQLDPYRISLVLI